MILDMGRTTVNLIGNCVATVVVARWENEFNYTKMEEFDKVYKRTKSSSSKFKILNSDIISKIPIEEHSKYYVENNDNL